MKNPPAGSMPSAKTQERLLKAIKANAPDLKGQFVFKRVADVISHLNAMVAVVLDGSNVSLVRWDSSGEPIFHTKHEAKLWLANKRFEPQDKDETPRAAFDVWIMSPERREYSRKVFNPNPATCKPGELNLFTGFAVKPSAPTVASTASAAEGWSLMQDHLLTIICRGDQTHYRTLLAWIAQLLQQPWRKSGFAVVLRGEMGTGKTTVSDWLSRIIGPRYCPVIDDPKLLTGKFNAHLEMALLLRVEEGFFAGNRGDRARMKHLLTGDSIQIERKGVDPYMAASYARAIFTSNSDWVVPAEGGERRYFVLDVSNARAKDKAYFSALNEQMENGGAEAMLHDLLALDISEFDFTKPPVTAGLSDQISQGFSPEVAWLETTLVEGRLPFPHDDDCDVHEVAVWEGSNGLEVSKTYALKSFSHIVPGYGRAPTSQSLSKFLLPYGVKASKKTIGKERVPSYLFPPLETLCQAFLDKHRGYSFPDLVEEEMPLAA
jgi:hypothetical protein